MIGQAQGQPSLWGGVLTWETESRAPGSAGGPCQWKQVLSRPGSGGEGLPEWEGS